MLKPQLNRITRTGLTSLAIAGMLSVPLAANPTSVEAAFPGYNGKILIQSNRDGNNELYVVNADGSNAVNLTNDPASDNNGKWSPNGERIAFFSNRDGNNEIYVMNADGSNQTRITNHASNDANPSWSPDGTKLLFESNRQDGTRLWVVDDDGSSLVCVTCGIVPWSGNAAWSPTGEFIAFQYAVAGIHYIYRIRPDGTGLKYLSGDGVFNDSIPSWSPDGTKITFLSLRDGNGQNEIYVMNADGTSQQRITNNEAYDSVPSFSPDGLRVAYTHADDLAGNPGSRDPWMVNTDGTNPVRLFKTGFTDWFNGWQPIPNTAPVTVVDTLTTHYNTSGSLNVLANDSDEEPLDSANLTISVQPSHGTASIVEGKVKYTPNADYVGADELTYQICDSFLLDQKCANAVLAITVQAPNTPVITVTKIGEATYANGTTTYTSDTARPTFSGTATAGATITVEIHSDPIILTTTADSTGNWSVTPDQDLPAGEHTVKITATKDGVTTELDSFVLGIAPQIPTTGADTSNLRLWGLALLAAGAGLGLSRRRAHRPSDTLPPLLPSR